MKTLHNLITTIAIVVLATMNVNARNVATSGEKAVDDLRIAIKTIVKDDFSNDNNYLNSNNINRLYESVIVVFYVDNQNKIQIHGTSCENCLASEYVEMLLDKKQLEAKGIPKNRMLRIQLTINYRL